MGNGYLVDRVRDSDGVEAELFAYPPLHRVGLRLYERGSDVYASFTSTQSAWLSDAIVRAVREIDPDYCPEGFVPVGQSDQARTDMRCVPDESAALRDNWQLASSGQRSAVNPEHYQGLDPEPIDVIEAWELDEDHYLANALKYIARAKRKGQFESDIKKAAWYLLRRVGLKDLCEKVK